MKIRKSDQHTLLLFAIVIAVAVFLVPQLSPDGLTDKAPTDTTRRKGKAGQYFAQPNVGYGDGSVASDAQGELFYFDPNTADSTQLLRLGLQPWQVRSIYKYRSKGGRYRQPSDFAQLYGLTLKQYRRLEPYIRIEKEVMARDVIARSPGRTETYGTSAGSTDKPRYPQGEQKLSLGQKVDINTADTTLLKRIPGIGSYFARRIVELRNRRQAFVDPEELLTIRNFPESALTYMTASANFPAIHINRMTQKELQAHPLLNYVQARDIVALRRTAGTISSLSDLSALSSFTPSLVKRIAPFVAFD